MRARTALAALPLLLAACGGGSSNGTGTTPQPRPSSAAVVAIDKPSNADEIKGPKVEVEIRLEGAKLVEQASGELRGDEGFLHLTLDNTLLTKTGTLKYTIPDVPPGEHVLRVELVAADHERFDPRVHTAVFFTVT